MHCLPQELIFKTRYGYSEIDDSHFYAHFRQVMWISHFCGHVKSENEHMKNLT